MLQKPAVLTLISHLASLVLWIGTDSSLTHNIILHDELTADHLINELRVVHSFTPLLFSSCWFVFKFSAKVSVFLACEGSCMCRLQCDNEMVKKTSKMLTVSYVHLSLEKSYFILRVASWHASYQGLQRTPGDYQSSAFTVQLEIFNEWWWSIKPTTGCLLYQQRF